MGLGGGDFRGIDLSGWKPDLRYLQASAVSFAWSLIRVLLFASRLAPTERGGDLSSEGLDDSVDFGHAGFEVVADIFEADFFVGFAGGGVHDYGQAGVGDIEFSGECGFGHAGHADDGAAVAFEASDLGGGFEAWALGGGVAAAVGGRDVGLLCGVEQGLTDGWAVGPGEVDVFDVGARAFEEGGGAAPGVVDELVRDDDAAGGRFFRDAAHGCHGDDAVDPGVRECAQVGAVIDLVRGDGVVVAVAREEGDRGVFDGAGNEAGGRGAPGGLGGLFFAVFDEVELVKPGAADYA